MFGPWQDHSWNTEAVTSFYNVRSEGKITACDVVLESVLHVRINVNGPLWAEKADLRSVAMQLLLNTGNDLFFYVLSVPVLSAALWRADICYKDKINVAFMIHFYLFLFYII